MYNVEMQNGLIFGEGGVLFGGHLGFGVGGFVALSGEMEHAMNEDAEQLPVKSGADHLGIRTDGIQRDEDIAVEGGGSGVIKSDDIRVIIMAEELTVHRQFTFVRAEDIIDIADRKTIVGRYGTYPSCYLALIQRRHVNILADILNHV